MPKTLIKPRLHPNKHKLKTKHELKELNQNYLQTFKHLNRNYYHEMVFQWIIELRRISIIR